MKSIALEKIDWSYGKMTNQSTKHCIAATVAVFALVGCASPKYVVSDVSRHHSLPSTPSGETFAIVAFDDEQEESLAFDSYSAIISQHLSKLGLQDSSGEQATPDIVVTLTWTVEGPSPNVKSRSSGFGYSLGYGNRYSNFGYGFGAPYDSRTSTRQMFVRRVELTLYDGATYNTEDPKQLFEGAAVSTGSNGQIDPVMPYIIQSIFDQFPGASGETRTVRVEVPPDSEAVLTRQLNSNSAK